MNLKNKLWLSVSLMFFSFFVVVQAETVCPFGLENDPYPGNCSLYTDENADQICDYSQTGVLESGVVLKEEHECEDDTEGVFAGDELKKLSVAEVAQLYGISEKLFAEKLSSELNMVVTGGTSVLTLHDDHDLKMVKFKEIAESLTSSKDFPDEGNDIEELINRQDSAFTKILDFLQETHIGILFVLIVFFTVAMLVNKKNPKLVKKIFGVLCYIVVPISALGLVIYKGLIESQGFEVWETGKILGYVSLWIFFLILIVKPLSILLASKKYKIPQAVHKFSSFVMRWRRQFGVLVFYAAFLHGLVYLLFWATKDATLFEFFNPTPFIVAIVAFISLFFPYLTSNNYSIKLLKKNWKKIQSLSYLAWIAAVVHIFLINDGVGYLLIVLSVIYGILKILEVKKIKSIKTH